jgi:hypothetical protein
MLKPPCDYTDRDTWQGRWVEGDDLNPPCDFLTEIHGTEDGVEGDNYDEPRNPDQIKKED